jgi:hypothetical protein
MPQKGISGTIRIQKFFSVAYMWNGGTGGEHGPELGWAGEGWEGERGED